MKSKRWKKVACSAAKTQKKGYSCFNYKEILELRKYWNTRHPDLKIRSKNGKMIWGHLKKYMSGFCYSERCWLQQRFMNNKVGKELLEHTFLVSAPDSWKRNPREWLNSLDLENIMRQYENNNKEFLFIGPSPMDFDAKRLYNGCVWEDICKFSLKEVINEKKRKIGFIFNLDPHYRSGSHWVSMFVDLTKKYIFYFDSNGDRAPKEINVLVDRIIEQGKELKMKLKYVENYPREHQMKNTECGIYSIYMITSLLKNEKKVEDFTSETKRRITDDDMFKLREKYFTHRHI